MAEGRPPDSHWARAAQLRPSVPATELGSSLVPTLTSWVTGSRTTSSAMGRGVCRTPLTVRRLYVTRRAPGRPTRSTTSVPANSSGSSTCSVSYGIRSSRTSRAPVMRSTVTVWPSRGKSVGGTEVVSWSWRVMPAWSRASRTVAALVRMARSRPSAMKVTLRSVRTLRASPARGTGAVRGAER